jgi:hypothetical protein
VLELLINRSQVLKETKMYDTYEVDVEVKIENIHCLDEGDGPGNAEPYLWSVFFKIDGETCKVNAALKLEGRATVITTSGNHGDLLRDGVDAGDNVPIPSSLGLIHTRLKPIYFDVPITVRNQRIDRVAGVVGCLVILLEEDFTPNDAIARGHEALNQAVQRELDNLIPTLGFGHPEVTDEDIEEISNRIGDSVTAAIEANVTVWEWLRGAANMDDKIGSKVFKVSLDVLNKLLENPNVQNPAFTFEETFNNEGIWVLNGWIAPSKVQDPSPVIGEPSPWQSLGGHLGGTLALATLDGNLEIFARGPGGNRPLFLGDKAWRAHPRYPGRWVAFGQATIESPPIAITMPVGNHIDVFARGSDNTLLHNTLKSWGFSIPNQDWESLSGTILGTPGAGYAIGQLHVYAHWNNDTIWYIRRHSEGWSEWSEFGNLNSGLPGYKVADSPVTFTAEDNVPRVFVRSQSNELLYSNLGMWSSLGGQIKGVPAVVSWGGSRIDVFACGMDDAVWHIYSDDANSWSSWESLGGVIAAPNSNPRILQREFSPAISASSTGSNSLQVIVRGVHGNIFRKTWNNTWLPADGSWEQLGNIVAVAGPVSIPLSLRIGGRAVTIAIRDKSGTVQLFP